MWLHVRTGCYQRNIPYLIKNRSFIIDVHSWWHSSPMNIIVMHKHYHSRKHSLPPWPKLRLVADLYSIIRIFHQSLSIVTYFACTLNRWMNFLLNYEQLYRTTNQLVNFGIRFQRSLEAIVIYWFIHSCWLFKCVAKCISLSVRLYLHFILVVGLLCLWHISGGRLMIVATVIVKRSYL